VGGYLEKRRGDVAKLRGALDRGHFATIRTLGHQLTGTGGGYGFEAITEIGSALSAALLPVIQCGCAQISTTCTATYAASGSTRV